jgi:hypothetical protein
MKSMMEIYQNAYRAFPLPMNPFELMQSGWSQGRTAQNTSGLAGSSTGSARQDASTIEAPRDSQRDDNELRRRIEELENVLTGRNRRPKPKKKVAGGKPRRRS